MSLGLGDGPVRPSRTTRADASLRRRRMYAVLAVLVVVALGLAAWARLGNGGTSAGSSPTATDSTGQRGRGPSELLAFSVTGAPSALLAVVGTGGGQPPAGFVLPPGMTVIVPGQGETTTEQVQALPGDPMRISVSNAVGVWVPHYAVMNLNGFGDTIDQVGGLTVNLADVYTVGAPERDRRGISIRGRSERDQAWILERPCVKKVLPLYLDTGDRRGESDLHHAPDDL